MVNVKFCRKHQFSREIKLVDSAINRKLTMNNQVHASFSKLKQKKNKNDLIIFPATAFFSRE